MPEIWLGPNSDFFIYAKTELQYLNCLESCGASADVRPVLGLFLLLSLLWYSMMRAPPLVEKSSGNSSTQTLRNKYGTWVALQGSAPAAVCGTQMLGGNTSNSLVTQVPPPPFKNLSIVVYDSLVILSVIEDKR